MRSLRCFVVLLSLCLALMTPVASAAEGSSAAARRDSSGLVGLFQQLGLFLSAVWEKTGCEIDPFGRCSPGGGATAARALDSSTTVWEEEAGHIDPFGGNSPTAVKGKYAGHIDPWGGNSPLTVDGGCEIDPFGRCGDR